MVSLLGLDAYSEEQLAQAAKWSPAFARYHALLGEMSPDSLHFIRHEAWLRCVLATYFQTTSAEAVCASWSDTADWILARTWRECGLEQFEATLMALGKHGARELNLSSDIDLILVAEGSQAQNLEKPLRRFMRLLQGQTDHGFCYRLDFDLRPGGKLGPLITTPSQFQDHYWSQGETWERLALVRLRGVAGSESLSRQTLELARKFSYRKFLDFTLLEDLKALRRQVHTQGFQRREGELHLKLEVGGIRDIELFVHSLLVLNGGKLPELQTRSTSAALAALGAKGLLPKGEAEELLQIYWSYRQQENLAQSIEDRQTHSLTSHLPAVPGLAGMREIESRMKRVDKVVSTLLGQVQLESAVQLPQQHETQVAWLQSLGFSDKAIAESWDSLIRATALSHKNDRDERARQQFLHAFVTAVASQKGLDRDLGLSLLVDFVRATRAKATFFTMLLSSPRLIQDLARLFCLSLYVGSIISSRPELLDHFILQLDEDWRDDLESLLQQMSERKLLSELWSANQFLADQNLEALCHRVSETADSIGSQLLKRLKQEFPGTSLEIVALGKWAGRELGLRSDLDFIFVSPLSPNEADFKVARRLLSRLSDPSKGGSLYDIDLRLRPSGQSGPLLVSLSQLHEYWKSTAKPWERQAYLRARVLGPNLSLDKTLLVERGLSQDEQLELSEIRQKLLRPANDERVDLKYAPGGLLDIELTVQSALLLKSLEPTGCATLNMISDMIKQSPSWQALGPDLKRIYSRLRSFEQMLRLSSAKKTGVAEVGTPVFQKTATLLNLSSGEAWAELQKLLTDSREGLRQLKSSIADGGS